MTSSAAATGPTCCAARAATTISVAVRARTRSPEAAARTSVAAAVAWTASVSAERPKALVVERFRRVAWPVHVPRDQHLAPVLVNRAEVGVEGVRGSLPVLEVDVV